jgi:hypothetical protein
LKEKQPDARRHGEQEPARERRPDSARIEGAEGEPLVKVRANLRGKFRVFSTKGGKCRS